MSLIIAEIGTSHEGSIEKALEMCKKAKESGADAIKFQWVYADEILHPDTGYVKLPTGNIRLYDRFKQLECSKDFYKECLDYVHSLGCKFCCSPFGIRSLHELLELNPDIVKIASPEVNHYPLLKELAAYRRRQSEKGEKPVSVIISSGVSKLSDIEKALEILGYDDVSLLHCITSYPAPESEYNLNVIKNLSGIFGIECGVSDHSLSPVLVPVLNTILGGKIIEKHFTLSKETSGLDDPVALEPEEFALMVHCIHQSEASLRHYGESLAFERAIEQLSEQFGKDMVMQVLGSGVKKLAASEEANYGRTNRSLHYMKSFKKGHVIKEEDIAVLRTEKELSPGLSPAFLEEVTGAVLQKDVSNGQGLSLSDFIEK